MGRLSLKRVLSRIFLVVTPKAVGFYPTDRDKAEKFAAANIPGVASGDIRDPFRPHVVRYFIPQTSDSTHDVSGDDANLVPTLVPKP
jgi:hypothetical protein